MNYTEEQITLAFEKLPRNTQDVLFTSGIKEQSKIIGAPLSVLSGWEEGLNDLINMTILKLVDKKDFEKELIALFKIGDTVAGEITSEAFSQIIDPIRLKEKKEEREQAESLQKESGEETVVIENVLEEKKERSNTWKSGSAPDNLPVAEAPEYLTPPIPPKSSNLEVEPPSEHPFEEKMKRVFTAGQQSMGDLTLAPIAPQTPNTAHAPYDPYRETIE